MPPIPPHSTATTDAAWDGPAMETNLNNGDGEKEYRQAFAWQDPDGNPDAKSSFRFIHHVVSSDGEVGAANTTACTTGIGVLNGGRGGTAIPDADRQGVYDHLAKHLRNANIDPPKLARSASGMAAIQLRSFPLETRESEAGLSLVGYATTWDSPYEIDDWLGSYTEQVRAGAFRKTLAEKDDVRLLVDHEGTPLARTKSGTMSLAEDDKGLRVEATLDPTNPRVTEMASALRRRDVDQMSFAFKATRQEWDDDYTKRTLVECRLFDVSVVAFPANPATSVALRARRLLQEVAALDDPADPVLCWLRSISAPPEPAELLPEPEPARAGFPLSLALAQARALRLKI